MSLMLTSVCALSEQYARSQLKQDAEQILFNATLTQITPTLVQRLVLAWFTDNEKLDKQCIALTKLSCSQPRKHKTFVKHLYNVGPTSKTLGLHCINVIQMFRVCWVAIPGKHDTSNQLCITVVPPSVTPAQQ